MHPQGGHALKEATPAGCCSHGFWAPGTPVGQGGGAGGGGGRGRTFAPPPGDSGQPAALSLCPGLQSFVCGQRWQHRGEAGAWGGGLLWTHWLSEARTSCPRLVPLPLVLGAGARCPGQCGGRALGSLSLPGWLGQGVAEGWFLRDLGSSL